MDPRHQTRDDDGGGGGSGSGSGGGWEGPNKICNEVSTREVDTPHDTHRAATNARRTAVGEKTPLESNANNPHAATAPPELGTTCFTGRRFNPAGNYR